VPVLDLLFADGLGERLTPGLAQQPKPLVEGDDPKPAGEVHRPLGLGAAELEPGVGAGVLGQGLGTAEPAAGHPHKPPVMAAKEL
jgi:hypothetical protein